VFQYAQSASWKPKSMTAKLVFCANLCVSACLRMLAIAHTCCGSTTHWWNVASCTTRLNGSLAAAPPSRSVSSGMSDNWALIMILPRTSERKTVPAHRKREMRCN